ncbi:gnat family n- protein [Apiospora arundinis]
MQLTTIRIILVAASAGSASPITARQTAHGSANLYSGATCNAANLIQANATVSSDSCTVLDEAVGSVRYNGIADWPSDDAYLWPLVGMIGKRCDFFSQVGGMFPGDCTSTTVGQTKMGSIRVILHTPL